MQWVFLAVVLVSVGVRPSLAGDCDPPKSGEKFTAPWECCKGKGDDLLPEDMVKNIKKCTEKYPLPAKPGSGPNPEVKKAMACSAECVFSEGKLLTADKKIDKDVVIKAFTSIAKVNAKDWEAILPKVVDKCFSTYSAEVDSSLECKSGALELEQCLLKESFLQCPKNLWTDSADCQALKKKLADCPKLHVFMMKPLA